MWSAFTGKGIAEREREREGAGDVVAFFSKAQSQQCYNRKKAQRLMCNE